MRRYDTGFALRQDIPQRHPDVVSFARHVSGELCLLEIFVERLHPRPIVPQDTVWQVQARQKVFRMGELLTVHPVHTDHDLTDEFDICEVVEDPW